MAALALAAIAAMFALFSRSVWLERVEAALRARSLLSAMSTARLESMTRGVPVRLCRSDAAGYCLKAGQACENGARDWSCGWAVWASGPGAPLWHVRPNRRVAIAAVNTDVVFSPPVGQPVGGFRSFEIGPSDARWRYCIYLAAGGRARLAHGACGGQP